mgnify:CR=1 FL=1
MENKNSLMWLLKFNNSFGTGNLPVSDRAIENKYMPETTPAEIIKQFEVYVDDLTELSTDEEYALLNKVLRTIYANRSWEFLRKNGSVVFNEANSGPLPNDFLSLMENYSESETDLADSVRIFVGSTPYNVISMANISYNQFKPVFYIDIVNRKLKCTQNIGVGTVAKFDYKYLPAKVKTTDSANAEAIVLPEIVRHYLPQIMAIDDDIIQKTEGGRSNIKVNIMSAKDLLTDLSHLNMRTLNY